MHLLRLRARNVFQYPSLDVDLDGALVAIVGRNGEGKSNLLRLIQFAVTGDVPKVTREDMLNWGAAARKETGLVELDFEHGTSAFTIRRSIGTATVWLKNTADGSVAARGAGPVSLAMGRMFDVDKAVGRTAFVPQGELDAVLFADRAERERGFQSLCGLAGAAGMHQLITRFMSTTFQDPPDYPGQLARAQAALVTVTAALADGRGRLAAMPRPEERGADASALQAATAVRAYASAMQTYHTTNARQVELVRARDEAATAAAAAGTAANSINAVALTTTLRQVDSAIAQNTQFQAATDAAKAARSYKESLAAGPAAQIASLDEAITRLSAQKAELDRTNSELAGQLQLLQPFGNALDTLVRVAGSVVACPVCEHPVSDPAALSARMRAKIAQVTAGIAAEQAASVARDLATKRSQRTDVGARLAEADTRLAAAEARLSGMGAPDRTLADLSALRAELQSSLTAHTRLLGEYDQAQRALAGAERAVANGQAIMAAAGTSATTALATLNGHPVLAGDIAAIVGTVNGTTGLAEAVSAMTAKAAEIETTTRAWMDSVSAYSRLSSSVESLDRDVQRVTLEIGQIQEQAAATERTQAVRASLARVRDWFHYSNGPAHLTARLLRAIVNDTNAHLADLQTPFRVLQAEGTLDFRVMFMDGRQQPDGGAPLTVLSGGQRVAVAIAFRLATYMSFASTLGVMSLDEPTQFLDHEAVTRFCELLAALRVTASRMRLQLFMATHEPAAIPFMDKVVDVEELKTQAQSPDPAAQVDTP